MPKVITKTITTLTEHGAASDEVLALARRSLAKIEKTPRNMVYGSRRFHVVGCKPSKGLTTAFRRQQGEIVFEVTCWGGLDHTDRYRIPAALQARAAIVIDSVIT